MRKNKRGARIIDLTGQRFLRLIALNIWFRKDKKIYWKCACDCGKFVAVEGGCLRDKKTKSCGCYQQERRGKSSITHGKSETVEYFIWTDLFSRCYNKKRAAYKNYGGRGIKICKRWHNFENFLADMGERPDPKLTLDRIDNNKGYCKNNCRWATVKQQAHNKRCTVYIMYKGKKRVLTELEKELGFKYRTLYQRLFKYKWPRNKAFTEPAKNLSLKYR